jgi:hypothetical protein
VQGRKALLAASVDRRRATEGTLAGYLLEEVRWAAQELGLSDVPPDVEPLLTDLARGTDGSQR